MQQIHPSQQMSQNQTLPLQGKLASFFQQHGPKAACAPPPPQQPPVPKYVPKPTRHQLVLSVYAYYKWKYMCYSTPLEVSAYGFARGDQSFQDLLYIEDLVILDQECSTAYTTMDADAILEYYDKLADRDIPLQRGTRVWFHTHPVMSAEPSSTDTDTFAESFDGPDWSVMAIISQTDDMSARLKITTPLAAIEEDINIKVDWSSYSRDLKRMAMEMESWEEEIKTRVRKLKPPVAAPMPATSNLQELWDTRTGWKQPSREQQEWADWEAQKYASLNQQLAEDTKTIFVTDEGDEFSHHEYFQEFLSIANDNGFDLVESAQGAFFQPMDKSVDWQYPIKHFRECYPEYILHHQLVNNYTWVNGAIDEEYVAQFSFHPQPSPVAAEAVVGG